MKNQSTLKTFFKFTSLNVLAMISLSCYILADTFFISKAFGANGLTSLNLAIPIYSLINGIGLMLGIGGATKFSIYKGKDKPNKGNITFTNSILLGLIFSCIFIFLGLFFSSKLSIILGADLKTLSNTNIYLKTLLLFAPFFITNNILIAYIRNDGNPKLAMIAMFIGSFSNIVLDYMFIFPLNMGMFGAAFATGLAPVISMLSLSYYIINKKNTFKLDKIKLVPRYLKSIIQLGLSSFIIEISSGIVIIIFNVIILNISGNTGVAIKITLTYAVITTFILSISRGFVLIIPLVLVLSKTFSLTGVCLSFTATELLSDSLSFYFLKITDISE